MIPSKPLQSNELNPLALYIHLPWCIKKCPYCDFNSHTGAVQSDEYTQALLQDLDFEIDSLNQQANTDGAKAAIHKRPITSIFFGGGTPSLFPAANIDQILTDVAQRLTLTPTTEITLEANPGAAEQDRFSGYRAAGVNRLSIGVQTFNDQYLRALGRVHSASDAIAAYEKAQTAGFENINLDIMYALPKQSLTDAYADCMQAIQLEPEHISHYQLTLEAGTAFAHRPPPLPDHDLAWDMQERCQSALATAGYRQYEVSAYAKSQRRCEHNLAYWNFNDYLGIGAGAHGKVSWPASDGNLSVRRRARRPHPVNFMQNAGTKAAIQHEQSVASVNDRVAEFALNALRLNDGFSLQAFIQKTGLPATVLTEKLDDCQQQDLLSVQQQTNGEIWVRPTPFGRQHLNALLLIFDDT